MREGREFDVPIEADASDSPVSIADKAAALEASRPISLMRLARVFLEIGATSFGGLGPSLAVIERELVEKCPILTGADVAEASAATRVLPGSTLIQITSFLGYRMRGWTGTAVATLAYLIPPACAMLAIAALSESLPSHAAFEPAARGLAAAVVGLLLASMWRVGRATIASPAASAIGLGAFGSAAFLRVPAAAVIVVAGMIGIFLLSAPKGERESGSRRGGGS